MLKTDSLAPADTREQAYRLLAERSPVKVVIDTDLPTGAWYVVRAPHPWEREQLAQEHADHAAMQQEKRRLTDETLAAAAMSRAVLPEQC